MLDRIKKTSDFIKQQIQSAPEVGIILGTGLGGLVNEITDKKELHYADIPNFPVSTVKGHSGKLIFGMLGNKKVVAMQGRFHFYEGYGMQDVTFPVRVMKEIGIKFLIVSNAAGGMNRGFTVGDIMIINDHINLMPSNPLIGHNFDELGPRFPDMSEAYDKKAIIQALTIANRNGIDVKQGVYAAVSGPTFETPAEYRYMRTIGADAVGMSTVPEVIVARHASIPVFAVSVITDLGGMDIAEPVTHEEVIKAANASEPKMTIIIKELLAELAL